MRLTWRVLDLCDSLVSAALAKEHSCGGGMREDVSADGLAAIGTGEECTGAGVALDLVCLVEMVSKSIIIATMGRQTINTQTLNSESC